MRAREREEFLAAKRERQARREGKFVPKLDDIGLEQSWESTSRQFGYSACRNCCCLSRHRSMPTSVPPTACRLAPSSPGSCSWPACTLYLTTLLDAILTLNLQSVLGPSLPKNHRLSTRPRREPSAEISSSPKPLGSNPLPRRAETATPSATSARPPRRTSPLPIPAQRTWSRDRQVAQTPCRGSAGPTLGLERGRSA